jgi:hypothetical protein
VQAGAEPHLASFDVILYTPADGTLTVEDLTRRGRRVGTLAVDPNGPLPSLDLDLTSIVTRQNLAQFGIRIQLRGANLPGLNDDKDDEGDDDKNEGDRQNNDRAHADGENDNKNGEHDDDKKRTPPPDVSASFTADLVFNSQ